MSALAQTTIPTSLPFDWQANLDMIFGLKGASTLTICFVIVKFINNVVLAGWFDQWIGKVKILVVSGVAVVINVIGLLIEGGHSVSQIIFLCIGAAATQVFIDQLQKQIFTKKGAV